MLLRAFITTAAFAAASAISGTVWIAFPSRSKLDLPAPLQALTAGSPSAVPGEFNKDFSALAAGLRSQVYRSFCGPASIATVLRAYGAKQLNQTEIFPSLGSKLDAFYTGMSLAELSALAASLGLRSEIAYADTLTFDTFRSRLKANLERDGDFVLVNYDRRVLKQAGAGHISSIGAYDEDRDAFLVLDEAAYRYPFTWVPARLLYDAVRTRDGDRFRGVLFIHAYEPSD